MLAQRIVLREIGFGAEALAWHVGGRHDFSADWPAAREVANWVLAKAGAMGWSSVVFAQMPSAPALAIPRAPDSSGCAGRTALWGWSDRLHAARPTQMEQDARRVLESLAQIRDHADAVGVDRITWVSGLEITDELGLLRRASSTL